MPVMLLAKHGTAPPATGRPGPIHRGKPAQPGRSQTVPCGPQTADDAAIGLALTVSWMLITGRLHPRPLLHTLPAEQLIDFWADDYTTRAPRTSSRQATASRGLPCR